MNAIKSITLTLNNFFNKFRYKKIGAESVITTYISENMVYSILKHYIKTNDDKSYTEDTGVVGFINRFTGKMTVRYRFLKVGDSKSIYYMTYYIVAKIYKSENNIKIRYFFACDRFAVWVYRLMGISFLYMAIQIFVLVGMKNIIPLIIAAFFVLCGIMLIFYKIKIEEASKVCEIFDRDIHALFPL